MNTNNSVVWVVHPVSLDLSAAEQWGRLKYINMEYVFGDQLEGGGIPISIFIQLRKAAQEFQENDDYLLTVGDHLQLIQFSSLLSARKSFRVLRYDREAKGYFPVSIRS